MNQIIKKMEDAIKSMENDLSRITSGNVAHKAANAKQGLNYLKLLIKDLQLETVNQQNHGWI